MSINVFKVAFSFLALHENPELLKTYTHRKTNLQHNREIKMSRMMIFWSDREIKMARNVEFWLNRENKLPQN